MTTSNHTLNNVLNLPNGAQLLKADLHIHTPASNDFEGDRENTTAQDIVETAIEKGLDVIAITDHNTVGWCDKVRAAAKGTALVVFPGVEVSTKEGHILAIFDVDAHNRTHEGFSHFCRNSQFPIRRPGTLQRDWI